MNDLNQRLLAAHAADDRHGLVTLYTEAADLAPDEDAQAFYLVHAYVFALETDHADAPTLRARLKALHREA